MSAPVLEPADHRAIAENVVEIMIDRGLVAAAPAPAPAAGTARVLSADQVADLLGRTRAWVYEHAVELGAIRMGGNRRGRLGFDRHTIDAWKHRQTIRPVAPVPPPPRRRGTKPTTNPDLIKFEEQ